MKHPERGVQLWIIGCLCWCIGMASAFGGVYAKGRHDGRGRVTIHDPCSMTMTRIDFLDARKFGPNPTIEIRGLMRALGCFSIDGVEIVDISVTTGRDNCAAISFDSTEEPINNVWVKDSLFVIDLPEEPG